MLKCVICELVFKEDDALNLHIQKQQLALVRPYMGRRGKFWLGHSFFTPSDFAEFLKLIFTASTRHTRKLKTSLKPSKTNLSFWTFFVNFGNNFLGIFFLTFLGHEG